MNKKIMNLLIEHNNNYNENYDIFTYKNDPIVTFEFECQNYVQPLVDNIIPLIFRDLNEPGNIDTIEDFLPYINEKYHNTVHAEMNAIRNADIIHARDTSKHLLQEFATKVISFYNKDATMREDFIQEFYIKNQSRINHITNISVEIALSTLSQLRNPKLQYLLVHKMSEEAKKNIIVHLNQLSKNELDNFIKKYFCYPLDMNVEQYHSKWLGKEKIHIKFAKSIIGRRYEYAKLLLKMANKGKTPILIERQEENIVA